MICQNMCQNMFHFSFTIWTECPALLSLASSSSSSEKLFSWSAFLPLAPQGTVWKKYCTQGYCCHKNCILIPLSRTVQICSSFIHLLVFIVIRFLSNFVPPPKTDIFFASRDVLAQRETLWGGVKKNLVLNKGVQKFMWNFPTTFILTGK